MLVQFSIKAQKPHCIQTCKCRLLQKNLQLCYSAILNVESNCSTIIKLNNSFLFNLTFSLSLFFVFFCPLSSFNDSLSLLQSSLPHSYSVSPSLTPYFSRCVVVACLWWISAWQGHGGGVFFCKVTTW